MQTLHDVQAWRGCDLVDRDGDKIGTIQDIYLDRHSGDPEWATVKTGLFGMKVSFVPIRDASATGDGQVRASVTKDQVKDAPKIDADGHLSDEEESRLYQHYGRSDYGDWTGEDRTAGLGLRDDDDTSARFSRDRDRDRDDATTGDAAMAGDAAMTRSEEELAVGTRGRETGRARLRKYVETEDQEHTVPVRRETARVEREPITDANRDAAVSGPEITESEHEVTLHEEEPVVEKRTVPKERVRLEKDTDVDQETVGGQVRKERIDTEGDV
jgi:uncharacterized protein (TIGR02271 family)